MSDDVDGELPAAPAAAESQPAIDSDALYLAKCLVADHGYVPGTFAEGRLLAEACDIVLTGGDGPGLAIACIVDRDLDPARRFTLPPAELDEAAAACRHHAGSMHGVKEAVTVEIWEVGAGVPDAADRARLEGYTFRPITQKGVQVKTYAVDTAAATRGDLVSTAADGLQREPWVRRVLRERRRTEAELAAAVQQRQKSPRFRTRPLVTYALLATMLLVFVVELAWAIAPASHTLTPSITSLIALGALDRSSVEAGEWWRLLTCVFLHGGAMHLISNAIALHLAGGVLENLVGRAWTLGLFVIGALGGSLASLTINPANVASVGASGAIMGLLAAAIVVSRRLPRGPVRTQILLFFAYILVLSLLPFTTNDAEHVDFAAHFGGAIAGGAAGGVLLATWRRDAEQPRGRKLAAAIAAIGLVLTGYGFIRAATRRDVYRARYAAQSQARDPALLKLLMPDAQNPGANDAAWAAAMPRLILSHPRDPRVQYMAGSQALAASDPATAKLHFERMLAERELITLLYGTDSDLEVLARALLAEIQEGEGSPPQARATLSPVCAAGKRSDNPDIRAYYERMCIAP